MAASTADGELPDPLADLPSQGFAYNGARVSRTRRASTEIQGRRKGFYLTEDPSSGKLIERETFGCGHCQHVTIVPHGQGLYDLGGVFCLACERPCCRSCAAKMAGGGMCDPFEKKLERGEARAALLRQVDALSHA